MKHCRAAVAGWVVAALGLHLGYAQAQPAVTFALDPGKVVITAGGDPVATYHYQNPKTPRPYFAHVHAPGRVQVTRNHPPIAGKDATDHADLHPGIWLAFADLSRADSWRNRAPVRHEKFLDPAGGPGPGGDRGGRPPGRGAGTFTVGNLYLAADGKKVVCRETCRYTFLVRPAGYLLLWDSSFRPEGEDCTFGDQEEMGLGIRIATPLTVKQGGRILTSDGHRNEKQVRGKQSAWCDYGGVVGRRAVGITVMMHPKNFRPSWYHARDYGLLVANPFGRNALTRGPASAVVVKKGETLRLRFGVLLHASPADRPLDLESAFGDYLKQSADE